ncbi:MAG: methenyltetrahydromethanopterin cyclohydrolase [Planctomycetota bacterium]
MRLNDRAAELANAIGADAALLRIEAGEVSGCKVYDLGVSAPGGLEAGRRMAEACLSGLGNVTIAEADPTVCRGPAVVVRTDHPVAACMASQYAGWQVSAGGYAAMASGPMRAAAAHEPLFAEPAFVAIAKRERGGPCVGVLEASELPGAGVCKQIADRCGVGLPMLTLLVAPTDSQAGSVQVVARSVETAMHKLHELGFDLTRVESGWGAAPLPPVAGDAFSGIGRTNDAVLYGGHAVLYVRGDDESISAIGPRAPSSASPDHGRPFQEVFKAHGDDFYEIDPLLFSPAVVTFVNLDTGATHRFGRYEPAVIAESFGYGGDRDSWPYKPADSGSPSAGGS